MSGWTTSVGWRRRGFGVRRARGLGIAAWGLVGRGCIARRLGGSAVQRRWARPATKGRPAARQSTTMSDPSESIPNSRQVVLPVLLPPRFFWLSVDRPAFIARLSTTVLDCPVLVLGLYDIRRAGDRDRVSDRACPRRLRSFFYPEPSK
jgi:hypothetical protein